MSLNYRMLYFSYLLLLLAKNLSFSYGCTYWYTLSNNHLLYSKIQGRTAAAIIVIVSSSAF